MDDSDGIVIYGSHFLNHPSTAPPQSKVVSVAHISNHDVVQPELTTHTVILLIHRREVSLKRKDLRVRKNNRDVLSPRSGDRSVDVIRGGGGHDPAATDMAGDCIDRRDDVLQVVRAGPPPVERRIGGSHLLFNS